MRVAVIFALLDEMVVADPEDDERQRPEDEEREEHHLRSGVEKAALPLDLSAELPR